MPDPWSVTAVPSINVISPSPFVPCGMSTLPPPCFTVGSPHQRCWTPSDPNVCILVYTPSDCAAKIQQEQFCAILWAAFLDAVHSDQLRAVSFTLCDQSLKYLFTEAPTHLFFRWKLSTQLQLCVRRIQFLVITTNRIIEDTMAWTWHM